MGVLLVKNRKNIWKTTPLYLFWILWQESNCKYFDGIHHSNQTLKDSFILYLFPLDSPTYWRWSCFLVWFYWLVECKRESVCCLFEVFLLLFWHPLYTSVYLGCAPYSMIVFLYILVCLSKRMKKLILPIFPLKYP